MEKTSLPVQFAFEGTHYKGWATPSDEHHKDGMARSYHMVLNDVFFGDLSHDDGHWIINEQRPKPLVDAAAALEKSLDQREDR